MAEHRPGSGQPLSELIDVRDCVTLPAVPAVYGLRHPEDGVTAWVFALPGGQACIVPSRGADLTDAASVPAGDMGSTEMASTPRARPSPRDTALGSAPSGQS